jgi:hypothetical protein
VPDESTFFFDEIETQFNIKIEEVVSQVFMPESIYFDKKLILDVVFSNKPRHYNDVCMYSNPLSDHLIIVLSKEKIVKTKSIQYHKNIFSHASFTDIATEKISNFLQLHSADVTLLELRVLDDPSLYDHLEGGVVQLLNPLLDIVKSAYVDSRNLLKSSHYIAENKYQKCFKKICKSLVKKT